MGAKKSDVEPQADEAEVPAADVAEEVVAEEVASEEAAAEPEIDPKLVKINAAMRPMRPADGSDGSCDQYKSDKAGNILVPAAEVPAMLEHGFVLVDEA